MEDQLIVSAKGFNKEILKTSQQSSYSLSSPYFLTRFLSRVFFAFEFLNLIKSNTMGTQSKPDQFQLSLKCLKRNVEFCSVASLPKLTVSF